MGDTKSSLDNADESCTSAKSLHKTSRPVHRQTEITTGSSGATLNPAASFCKNVANEEHGNGGTPRSTRRGRSAIHSVENAKMCEGDGKQGSPGDPTAYLNSVRSNLNFDFSSSPTNERSNTGTGTSSNGKNGNLNGYRPPQKKKSRLLESGGHHKPAEVFRKDLISAMKIPDTSHLSADVYWVMRDPWRMEWEKGVQVPVNLDALPAIKVIHVPKDVKGDFRMPKKLIKTTPDFGDRDTVNLNVLADKTCRYDLDEVDIAWLKVINEERYWQGYEPLDEFTVEIIMEELESQCHESMQLAIKTKEGLGIEYDENIVCDVCRQPDSEDSNEMVFCDGCNLCVHQACYGILKVPEGSWLCKPCALGVRGSVVCVLCGKKGGAMKSTKSGRKWTHMSCALWIPEVNIGDPERMEPITKISHVPISRWSLLCTVCKERSVGACIQCNVKHCVTAYHVTCAMDSGFEMLTRCCSPSSTPNAGDSNVMFRSFCPKHGKNRKNKSENSPSKKSEEEKRSDRQKKIADLEAQFFTFVRSEGITASLNIPHETTSQVMEYWKLKRKANFNRSLVTPKQEEGKALEEAAETGLQRRLRMFTHLRQDLERVRNLCYMIGRREKFKRCVVVNMRNVFLEQIHYLESLMLQNKSFNPRTLVATLPKFGSERLVKLAKAESKELAKTKEWCTENSSDETGEIPLPDDVEDTCETIRILPPVPKVKEASPEQKNPHSEKLKRKNGLVKDIKRVKSHVKFGKPERSKSSKLAMSEASDLIKKERPSSVATPSASDSDDRTKQRPLLTADGSTRDPLSSRHKVQRSTRRGSQSEIDDISKVDTVKEGGSSQKSAARKRRKRGSLSGTDKESRDEADERLIEDRKIVGTCQKKIRVTSDGNQLEKQGKLPTKEHTQKRRRSPRHTDSSDADDFEVPKSNATKHRMTITTNTISETDRIDHKKRRVEDKKERLSPKNLDARSRTETRKIKRKTEHGHFKEEGSERSKEKDSSRSQSNNSTMENRAPSSRSTRSGSKNNESEHPSARYLRSRSMSDESAQLRDNDTNTIATKNEERALAPSSEIDNTGTEHDKKDDINVEVTRPVSPVSVQELGDQKRLESANSTGSRTRKSPSQEKLLRNSPTIALEKPNPAFVAAGLDISYGSNAPLPLRQNSTCKSPAKTRSSGLKWVSLSEDSGVCQARDSSVPKLQDGYHGDVDESSVETAKGRPGGNQKQTLSRKQTSVNPGKYRTGIGVFSTKISDSSDDDFDIPIPSSTEKTVTRQKLRSISNDIRYDSPENTNITQTISKHERSSNLPKEQGDIKANEPKNVRAVGGILDAQRSEHSANVSPHESRTTGGKQSRDNFFEKFSFMTERPSNSSLQPFGANGPTSNLSFSPNQYVPAKLLDFQQGAFRSHRLFPFGTPINPWQVSTSNLPSIIPNQYQNTFYPYPSTHHVHEREAQVDVRPSPPPLPDSTLSPESGFPNSVAVQASERSITPVKNKSLRDQRHPINFDNHSEDNEWEIVREDDSCHTGPRHHRKHKKKKKKKKQRKRMRFPDGYESEKREISSPIRTLPGPIHGAIVPKGHSTQYGTGTDSMQSSQESEYTESGPNKPHKLVLKINKKDLISTSQHELSNPDSHAQKDTPGVKLTIKKSKYEHAMKKYKGHKGFQPSTHETPDSVSKTQVSHKIKSNIDKKSSMLRRLGIKGDNPPNKRDEMDGIGRRALRERKSETSNDVKKTSGLSQNREKVRNKTSKVMHDRKVDDRKSNASIAAGKIPKRMKGRPKKTSAVKNVAVKEEPQDVKYKELQSPRDEPKDLAKFAGWSTKSSNYANHKQPLSKTSSIRTMTSQFRPSSVGIRGRGNTIPIRSFSTDSDQTFSHTVNNSQDGQPARHWKKRKVHEHETQASEQPDCILPPSDKYSDLTAPASANQLDTDLVDHFSRKLPKRRSLEFSSSGGKHERGRVSQVKGQKLNQIITSLGEKASGKAVESRKIATNPTMKLQHPFNISEKTSTLSSSQEKSLFSKSENQISTGHDAKGNKNASSPFPTKQRTKSDSSNPTPTKSYLPAYNVDFALQTGPLNYKIPKKLHQTVNEGKLTDS